MSKLLPQRTETIPSKIDELFNYNPYLGLDFFREIEARDFDSVRRTGRHLFNGVRVIPMKDYNKNGTLDDKPIIPKEFYNL